MIMAGAYPMSPEFKLRATTAGDSS
jgi:hypothetical protein